MRVALTQGYIALVDKEDYIRVKCYKWFASKATIKYHGAFAVPNKKEIK